MTAGHTVHLDPSAEHQLNALVARHCPPTWSAIVHQCSGRLVNLMVESGDKPLDHLKLTVRLIVQEQIDGGECGDGVACDPHDLHRVVETVLEAMRELRTQRQQEGRWGQTAVPPIMFG